MIEGERIDHWKTMHLTFRLNPSRGLQAGLVLLIFTVLITSTRVSVADSDPKLAKVIDNLSSNQRVRIWTNDVRFLGGCFIRLEGDSLYLGSLPGCVATEQDGLDEDSQKTAVVCLSEINLMWKIDNHGLSRGLLWAGGVLLVGGALTYAAGEQITSLEDAMVYFGVTIAAATYAFYKGASGSKETMVYSRYK